MSIHHLTSPGFVGFVEFEFDAAGFLMRTDMTNAELSEQQHTWIVKRAPNRLSEITKLLESTQAKFEEVKLEINFELFWNRYNEKVRSSKKKAQVTWNRMSKADQVKAFNYIAKYKQSIPSGVACKYAETYLNAELWNN